MTAPKVPPVVGHIAREVAASLGRIGYRAISAAVSTALEAAGEAQGEDTEEEAEADAAPSAEAARKIIRDRLNRERGEAMKTQFDRDAVGVS